MSSPEHGTTAKSVSTRDAAITELFGSKREPMARLAYVLTRNPEIADELVQDAFLQLHRNWGRVAQPVAYLRTAVVNGCHSHHRHLRVVRDAPVYRPDPSAEPQRFDDELDRALARLPFEQRAVLALRYFDDLDDVEIAAALGIRRSTVRTRAHRALAQLRKEIAS